MTLARRQLVRIGLTIVLDLLNTSTVGSAVSVSRIQLRAVRLELAFQNNLPKEYPLQPDHGELVVLAGPADEFRFDDRWLIEIFVATVVVNHPEYIIHSDVRNENGSNPVMNEFVVNLLQASFSRGRNQNFTFADALAPAGLFLDPQEWMAGSEIAVHT